MTRSGEKHEEKGFACGFLSLGVHKVIGEI